MNLGVGVVVSFQGFVGVPTGALGRHERQDHVDPHRSLDGGVNVDLLDLGHDVAQNVRWRGPRPAVPLLGVLVVGVVAVAADGAGDPGTVGVAILGAAAIPVRGTGIPARGTSIPVRGTGRTKVRFKSWRVNVLCVYRYIL